MNIDWSKAPEGATHWDLGMNSRVAGWMKLDDGIWYWWPVKDAKCDMKWHSSLNQHLIEMQNFIARPCDWTGEGLPPAGTVCEYQTTSWPSDQWEVRKVRYISPYHVITAEKDGTERCVCADIARFRKLRTPEQIAAEERDMARTEILNAMTADGRTQGENEENWQFRMQIIGEILDMGYRKQVQP